jgi:DNA-binding Xre family transcriptional regulator
MRVNYNKFFYLLIQKQMKKGDLCRKAGINTNIMGKMAKSQNLSVDILVRICAALNCKMDDIMDLIPDEDDIIEQIPDSPEEAQ